MPGAPARSIQWRNRKVKPRRKLFDKAPEWPLRECIPEIQWEVEAAAPRESIPSILVGCNDWSPQQSALRAEPSSRPAERLASGFRAVYRFPNAQSPKFVDPDFRAG